MRGNKEIQARDAALVRAAIRGDKESLGTLLVLYRPHLATIAYRILRSARLEHHTDEVVSDATLALVRGFRIFKPAEGHPTGDFLPWFRTIVKNTCLNFIERNPVLRDIEPLAVPGGGLSVDIAEGVYDESPCSDPLDKLSHEEWERDVPDMPISYAVKFMPKRPRAAGKTTKRRPSHGPGKYLRKPPANLSEITRQREEWAASP